MFEVLVSRRTVDIGFGLVLVVVVDGSLVCQSTAVTMVAQIQREREKE